MNQNMLPQWEREFADILGIKRTIILSGKIYDVYPNIINDAGDIYFTDLNRTLVRAIRLKQKNIRQNENEMVQIVFCDPVNGFCTFAGESGYSAGTEKEQRAVLDPLLEGYEYDETERNGRIYYRPTKKKSDEKSNRAQEECYMSEIIHDAMIDVSNDNKWIVFVLNFASRLNDIHQKTEAEKMFVHLFATIINEHTKTSCGMENTIMFVVDRAGDLPQWFYQNNPYYHTIEIGYPDINTRRQYLKSFTEWDVLSDYEVLCRSDSEEGKEFLALTGEHQCREIGDILKLAYTKQIKPENIKTAFRIYKYGIRDNPWDLLDDEILERMHKELMCRVKGQNKALKIVENIIERAMTGGLDYLYSDNKKKPRGVFFLAGPSGVGKTETAKIIAKVLFGEEEAMIRFDMTEYQEEHSTQRLFGPPPGYVGYEEGGQLTNAVKKRPFCVLLFDEIEKAAPRVKNTFLQMLDDGRMTDGQGNTVDFSECIVIFTSNLGLTEVRRDDNNHPMFDANNNPILVEAIKIDDTCECVEEKIVESVKGYFKPEELTRIGEENIIVYQYISEEAAREICESKIELVRQRTQRKDGVRLQVEEVLPLLKEKAVEQRRNGGRGITKMLEREFMTPLMQHIRKNSEKKNLRCFMKEDSIIFEETMELIPVNAEHIN